MCATSESTTAAPRRRSSVPRWPPARSPGWPRSSSSTRPSIRIASPASRRKKPRARACCARSPPPEPDGRDEDADGRDRRLGWHRALHVEPVRGARARGRRGRAPDQPRVGAGASLVGLRGRPVLLGRRRIPRQREGASRPRRERAARRRPRAERALDTPRRAAVAVDPAPRAGRDDDPQRAHARAHPLGRLDALEVLRGGRRDRRAHQAGGGGRPAAHSRRPDRAHPSRRRRLPARQRTPRSARGARGARPAGRCPDRARLRRDPSVQGNSRRHRRTARAAPTPRGRAPGDRRPAPGRHGRGVSRGDPARRRGGRRDIPARLRPGRGGEDLFRGRRRRGLQLPRRHRQRIAAPGVRPRHAGGRDRRRELPRVPDRRHDRAPDRPGRRARPGPRARRRAGPTRGRGAHGRGGARAGGLRVVVGGERHGHRAALRDARPRGGVILALAVAAVALVVRVLVADFQPVIQPDGVVYLAVAKQFQATGSPFDPLFHPLYPMCIALAQPLIGDWEMSGRLVSAVFTAVHPRLVQNSASVLCEATYTFLLVSGVLAARRGLVGGPRALVPFAGLCLGLSYLVRPEGALYLVGLVLVALFMILTGRDRAGAVLPWVGAAVLVFAIVVAPYVWYLAEVWGHVTLSGKIEHNLPLSTGAATAPSPLPLRVLENVLLFQKYAVPDLLPWILLLLVLPGMLARGRTPGWLDREGLLIAAALPPFASLALHVEPRIFLPILPFILPFAAAGTLWAA